MPLYLVILIAFTGYSMMVTIFVPMLMYDHAFFGGDVSRAAKTTVIGVLLALYPLGQLIGSPVIGALSDRFGRKRVLTISLFFTTAFYLLIALSLEIHLLWLLMAACFMCGLTESNVAIAQSSVADISLPEDRGRLFAYLYSAESIGYIAGPLFGGLMAVHFGYAFPFWLTTGLLVVAYVWVITGYRDSFKPDTDKPIDYFKTFTNLATVLTDRPIRMVYLVNFLLYLSAFGFWRVIQIYMVDKWSFAIQVGAESLSALLGGLLAAYLIPLPLLTYGIIAVLGGLLLITYKEINTNSGKI